jgi:diguanylate cyclase (GGDEF)-like protein
MVVSHLSSLLAIGCVAVFAFLPGQAVDRRAVLTIMGLQAATSVAVGLLPWPRLFASGRGENLLRTWSAFSVVQIGIGVAVTGGSASPLFMLFAFSAVFFAAAWPLRTQAWLAVLSVCTYLVAVRAGPSPVEANAVFIRIAILLIVTFVAAHLSGELQRQLVAHVRARGELEERAAELERVAAEKEHLALHDVLTGLPNRALFADRIAQSLASAGRRDERVAVLILDLDGFKEVNDALGHHHGDALLCAIGPRLREVLRAEDTIARMGGDEYAVLVAGIADAAAAAIVAEKVVRALERPFEIGSLALGIEASVGVAIYPEHGAGEDDLVRHADDAMYAAKTDKTGWALYEPAREDLAPRRLEILAEFRRALDENELVLRYQPMIHMSSGTLHGVEALVRWEHPTRGLVPPREFVPLVEQTGLIGPLTLAVLDQALAQSRVWRDRGHMVPVSVNLSVRNLHHLAFPDEVAALLARHSLPASALELEITESAVMTHPRRGAAVLERLDAMGIRLVLDDFGTGYSSLSYLTQLPVSQLKIDRSFVLSMEADKNDLVIVRSVINIGRNLGLTVVAEGVEDERTWARLSGYGCEIAQGEYLSGPVPAADVDRWLGPAQADARATA